MHADSKAQKQTILIYPKAPAYRFVDSISARLQDHCLQTTRIDARGDDLVLCVQAPMTFADEVRSWTEVERVVVFDGQYGLVSRAPGMPTSRVPLGAMEIGGPGVVVIAGPCGVENRAQLSLVAKSVRESGAHGLRGGAFKPRTSPYAFQGLGRRGLELLAESRALTGLPVVTEVMTAEDVPLVSEFADMVQIGSRNMQNFRLLEAVGHCDRPVLLKRGMAATLDEFLAAAEYIYVRGNTRIVLCERGIKGSEPRLRNLLDLSGAVLLKQLSHLPVIIDPSHATGLRELVPDLARASIAAGLDGLMIEVHGHPESALSDGRQSLRPSEFASLMATLPSVARAVGREWHSLDARQAGTASV